MNWLYAHGGPVGLILIFNMTMMGIQRICLIMKLQEPPWLQKMGQIGSSMASWASANTVTPAPSPKPSVTDSKPTTG